MLNAKAFANAATVVTAIFYIICVVLVYILPDFVFEIGKSWMHSINLDSVKAAATPNLGTALMGLITMSALTWVTTYAVIALYNRWAK